MLIGFMFEQLACCIHLFVFFPSLKNSFSSSSTASRQILDRFSTNSYLSSPSFFLSQQKLMQSRSIEISGLCLDRCSTISLIHRETFCMADRFSTASRSIEVCLPSTDSRQHLDRFISVEIQYSIDLDSSSIHRAAISI